MRARLLLRTLATVGLGIAGGYLASKAWAEAAS